jgi:hypothetical protein
VAIVKEQWAAILAVLKLLRGQVTVDAGSGKF